MASETIADFVADLKSDKRRFSNSDSTAIACRIEAAAKRDAAGNAAAMREALERLLKWVEVHTSIYSIRVAPIEDDPKAVENEKNEAEAMSRAALAAPPRNCDRFRDWDSAAAEYERLVQEGKAEDGTWCEWLFSVGQYASAQEGAANA